MGVLNVSHKAQKGGYSTMPYLTEKKGVLGEINMQKSACAFMLLYSHAQLPDLKENMTKKVFRQSLSFIEHVHNLRVQNVADRIPDHECLH